MQNYILPIHYNGQKCYDIQIRDDFDNLAELVAGLGFSNKRIMIVTDSNVEKYYLDEISDILSSVSDSVFSYVFPAGESSKNLDTIYRIYERLITEKFDRKDLLVALGGGVVGDMTGFSAATYLRGISFIQVPTTVIAQCDSSIGGKTGVDFKAYKNMVGAFHMPKLVYINSNALNTLPNRDFYSGMGEVIKHGLIKDRTFFNWLIENKDAIMDLDHDCIKHMIFENCKIKKEVVEEDPKELSIRAILNFGHTIGHAVEKLKNFSLYHGECISIGFNAASYLSYKRGFISLNELNTIKETLLMFNLPITISGLDAEEIAECTLNDKKMESNRIKFILIKSIGEAFIDTTVSKEEIIEACNYILKDN